MDFKIITTKTGSPALTAGGGAYTNTYESRTVLTTEKKLKTALFIRTTGHLSNANDQAILPIAVGDIIITLKGNLPINDRNPDAEIRGYKITKIIIQDLIATATEITITHNEIPQTIISGTKTYHNRDGNFFCNEPEPEQEGKNNVR